MKDRPPDFYLASSEGYGIEDSRKAWRIKRLQSDFRDDLLLIEIDPPLIGQHYGLGEQDVHQVIVATRHKGASLFPISAWPVYVYVLLPLIANVEERDKIYHSEYQNIAWAELYPTVAAAREKRV
ncbi:MAG TPA: hypothetical protein VFA07_08335 [Chthonomonadaceae bacterium]|nr:hypothetical protein [Chthonomonadaceae bacterium]